MILHIYESSESDCRSRVMSLIPARSQTFVKIDYGHSPSRVVVSYKGKYVQGVLVNRLVKLAQEKSVVR